jgi:hypothetical protein
LLESRESRDCNGCFLILFALPSMEALLAPSMDTASMLVASRGLLTEGEKGLERVTTEEDALGAVTAGVDEDEEEEEAEEEEAAEEEEEEEVVLATLFAVETGAETVLDGLGEETVLGTAATEAATEAVAGTVGAEFLNMDDCVAFLFER